MTTSTTTIAGAGVLGNQRRPDESCAGEPAHPELGEGPLRVNSGTDRGEVDVPADPQRIIVLSGDQLDALCALGLQSRIVAAATGIVDPARVVATGTGPIINLAILDRDGAGAPIGRGIFQPPPALFTTGD